MGCLTCDNMSVDTSGCFDHIICRVNGWVKITSLCAYKIEKNPKMDSDGQLFLFEEVI